MKKALLIKWLILFGILILIPSLVMAQNYVGSGKCASCHKAIYETWKDTLHNKSQQILSPTNNSVVVDWKGTVKLKAGKLSEATIKLVEEPDRIHKATLVDTKDPSKEVTYTVVRTYGGWGWKQRYQVKIGNNHYILPIQWNQATSRWVPYNLQNWYNEDGSLKQPSIDKSFEMSCAGCHNTGLELKKVDKVYEAKYSELNTGCEKCHGPGSEHVKAPRTKGKIINPKKINYERGLEVCGQCHSRGVSVPNGTFGFPWNDKENKPYKLGEPFANYYQFKPGEWGDTRAHAKSHHQQWHDFLKSTHFQAKVNCFDCHDPHGGPGRFQLTKADFNNNLCLSCHGKDKKFANPGAIRMHTKHNYAPETKGTSRCSSCHLVKTASSAEAGDVHAHD
ncbi:MAG: ammonia-forming cytochrome c nitrite reductase subunit c552, partial [Deltaproteobacteria bacterium]|nr:ammonia-forming cytochrome c nitrite reductase subunit c552 [Deltaproteobacteria bacterium]